MDKQNTKPWLLKGMSLVFLFALVFKIYLAKKFATFMKPVEI